MSDKRKAETIIRDGYVEFKHVIEAPLSAKVTKSIKDDVWTTITNRVNAEAVAVKRTPAEIVKNIYIHVCSHNEYFTYKLLKILQTHV